MTEGVFTARENIEGKIEAERGGNGKASKKESMYEETHQIHVDVVCETLLKLIVRFAKRSSASETFFKILLSTGICLLFHLLFILQCTRQSCLVMFPRNSFLTERLPLSNAN